MASSQSTTYTSYPCLLWGKKFDDLVETVETGSDPTLKPYRFIRYESFEQHLSFLEIPIVIALLIRDEYNELYNFLSRKSLPTGRILGDAFSGSAVIGHPGIGQLRLHRVLPEDCLIGMVMFRQVSVSVVHALSPPVRTKAHRVPI